MKLTNISIHHFGGMANNPFYKSSQLTGEMIEVAHRNRWPDFPSELNGSFIGYNIIIFPDGTWKQYRFLGEETAANKGFNTNTFSACLAGNFTKNVEMPTVAQKMRLKEILQALLDNDPDRVGIKVKKGGGYDFSANRIYSHRALQGGTECYGTGLPDSWPKDLLGSFYLDNELQERVSMLTKLLELLKTMLQLKAKLGGVHSHCLDNARG